MENSNCMYDKKERKKKLSPLFVFFVLLVHKCNINIYKHCRADVFLFSIYYCRAFYQQQLQQQLGHFFFSFRFISVILFYFNSLLSMRNEKSISKKTNNKINCHCCKFFFFFFTLLNCILAFFESTLTIVITFISIQQLIR